MNTIELIKKYNLNNSFVIGYYGGGNYGDELLLEVLLNLLQQSGVDHLKIYYQSPHLFAQYHYDFGYNIVDATSKRQLFSAFMACNNIVVGGGGIWGLDVNKNILLLSSLMFILRFIGRKRIFLLNVGFYNSTNRLGRISAWLASKSADHILARDQESYINFKRYSQRTHQEQDLSSYIPHLNLNRYAQEAQALQKSLPIKGRTVFATIRRFQKKYQNTYTQELEKTIASLTNTPFIVGMLEPKQMDPQGYEFLQHLAQNYSNVTIFDYTFNPLAFYLYFKHNQQHLKIIAPQYHAIITAHQAHIPFLPLVYDNKVAEFYGQIHLDNWKDIKDCRAGYMWDFLESES